MSIRYYIVNFNKHIVHHNYWFSTPKRYLSLLISQAQFKNTHLIGGEVFLFTTDYINSKSRYLSLCNFTERIVPCNYQFFTLANLSRFERTRDQVEVFLLISLLGGLHLIMYSPHSMYICFRSCTFHARIQKFSSKSKYLVSISPNSAA